MARKPAPLRLGAQDDKALLTPGVVRDRLVANLRRQGAKDVRLNVVYGKTKAEGYGALDEAVNYLRAHGLKPQMTIMGTPDYSPTLDQGLSARNANPQLLQQYAGEVAKHFKGRVGRYSIWNEPNLNTFLMGAQGNAKAGGRRYRDLYRHGYAGVKGADPTAQVMFGELAPTGDVAQFLRYATAGKKPVRTAGVAFHPYETGSGPTWDITNLPAMQRVLESYKRQGRLQTNQGAAAPLYLTEFGYQRAEMTPAQQRARLANAFHLAGQAHARQLVQYQLTPTPPKMVTTAATMGADAYGNAFGAPGSTRRSADWQWDTSVGDAAGNIPTIWSKRAKVTPRTARAARVRRKR
jgi:hypothetical protein